MQICSPMHDLCADCSAPVAIAQNSNNCPTGPVSQLNNVESLRTLIRNEVASEVEAEVARRLPAAVETEVQRRLESTPGQLESNKLPLATRLHSGVLRPVYVSAYVYCILLW